MRISVSVMKRYLPPTLISEILGGNLSMDKPAELRHITVLFSDLKGFTSTSASLGPEGISKILNEYLTEMNKVIFEFGGTIDKFIGDAVMVLVRLRICPPNSRSNARHAAHSRCMKHWTDLR